MKEPFVPKKKYTAVITLLLVQLLSSSLLHIPNQLWLSHCFRLFFYFSLKVLCLLGCYFFSLKLPHVVVAADVASLMPFLKCDSCSSVYTYSVGLSFTQDCDKSKKHRKSVIELNYEHDYLLNCTTRGPITI